MVLWIARVYIPGTNTQPDGVVWANGRKNDMAKKKQAPDRDLDRTISVRLTPESVELLRALKLTYGTPYSTTITRMLAWFAAQPAEDAMRVIAEAGKILSDDAA